MYCELIALTAEEAGSESEVSTIHATKPPSYHRRALCSSAACRGANVILSSFPQNTAVGSSSSAAVGSELSAQGVAISSGGFGFGGLGCFNGWRARYPC